MARILTTQSRYKRPPKRRKQAPGLTPEEHQQHGDAAEALWRESRATS